MCGIIGYAGEREAATILLDGLARLEYRGYDSVGIAVLAQDGKIAVHKRAGKLDGLASKLEDGLPAGQLGIGHTRWATHGKPTDANASNTFCFVLLGLILFFFCVCLFRGGGGGGGAGWSCCRGMARSDDRRRRGCGPSSGSRTALVLTLAITPDSVGPTPSSSASASAGVTRWPRPPSPEPTASGAGDDVVLLGDSVTEQAFGYLGGPTAGAPARLHRSSHIDDPPRRRRPCRGHPQRGEHRHGRGRGRTQRRRAVGRRLDRRRRGSLAGDARRHPRRDRASPWCSRLGRSAPRHPLGARHGADARRRRAPRGRPPGRGIATTRSTGSRSSPSTRTTSPPTASTSPPTPPRPPASPSTGTPSPPATPSRPPPPDPPRRHVP